MLIDKHLPYINAMLSNLGRHTLPLLCIHVIEDDVIPWILLFALYFRSITGMERVFSFLSSKLLLTACKIFFPELGKQTNQKLKTVSPTIAQA